MYVNINQHTIGLTAARAQVSAYVYKEQYYYYYIYIKNIINNLLLLYGASAVLCTLEVRFAGSLRGPIMCYFLYLVS